LKAQRVLISDLSIDPANARKHSQRNLEARPMVMDIDDGAPRFTPTLKEIAEACRQIQRGWSPEERIKRRRVTPSRAGDTTGVERVARESLEFTLARRRAAKAG
jgi:hypothetical protein